MSLASSAPAKAGARGRMMVDMTWTAPQIDRTDSRYVGDERTILEGYLDWHRQTLLLKCAGLTAEQLKTASVEPSNLTLLGLVRHMAEVERCVVQRPGGRPADEAPLLHRGEPGRRLRRRRRRRRRGGLRHLRGRVRGCPRGRGRPAAGAHLRSSPAAEAR